MSRLFGAATLAIAGIFAFNATLISSQGRAQTLNAPVQNVTPANTTPIAQPSDSVPLSPTDAANATTDTASSLSALVEQRRGANAPDAEGRCLAEAVYFESRGEPLEGQLAVAEVMLNRVKSGRFADSLCGVVKQPSQFSFVHHGVMPQVPEGAYTWQTALAVADIARQGLWQSGVGHAMYFHARRVSPHWHATELASLGHHIFYR